MLHQQPKTHWAKCYINNQKHIGQNVISTIKEYVVMNLYEFVLIIVLLYFDSTES